MTTQILSGREESRPLAPAAAITLARALLRRHGLEDVAQSTRGDSFYLRRPEGGGGIRVSTHRRTAKRRRQYPGIATSIVIDRPTSEAKLRTRVAAALRDAEAWNTETWNTEAGNIGMGDVRHAP